MNPSPAPTQKLTEFVLVCPNDSCGLEVTQDQEKCLCGCNLKKLKPVKEEIPQFNNPENQEEKKFPYVEITSLQEPPKIEFIELLPETQRPEPFKPRAPVSKLNPVIVGIGLGNKKRILDLKLQLDSEPDPAVHPLEVLKANADTWVPDEDKAPWYVRLWNAVVNFRLR